MRRVAKMLECLHAARWVLCLNPGNSGYDYKSAKVFLIRVHSKWEVIGKELADTYSTISISSFVFKKYQMLEPLQQCKFDSDKTFVSRYRVSSVKRFSHFRLLSFFIHFLPKTSLQKGDQHHKILKVTFKDVFRGLSVHPWIPFSRVFSVEDKKIRKKNTANKITRL